MLCLHEGWKPLSYWECVIINISGIFCTCHDRNKWLKSKWIFMVILCFYHFKKLGVYY